MAPSISTNPYLQSQLLSIDEVFAREMLCVDFEKNTLKKCNIPDRVAASEVRIQDAKKRILNEAAELSLGGCNASLQNEVDIARRRAQVAEARLGTARANQHAHNGEADVIRRRLEEKLKHREQLQEELAAIKASHAISRKITDLETKNEELKMFVKEFGKQKTALDDACLKMLMEQKPSRDESHDSVGLRNLIENVLRSLHIVGDLAFYGSRENGFGSTYSDFDVTIQRQNADAVTILASVSEALQHYKDVSKINFVSSARVPVLKFFYFERAVDLCVNNELGVANTKLLRAYCSLDPRVGLLGRLVKTWAKQSNVCGSQDGYFNSYAWVLMTIFYLQNLEDPVVPNLMKQHQEPVFIQQDGRTFDVSFKVPEGWRSKSTQSAVALFRGFLQYYGQEFQWDERKVSISNGRAVTPSVIGWSVEDPFDRNHELARPVGRLAQRQILTALRTAFSQTLSGKVNKFKKLCLDEPVKRYALKMIIRGGLNPQAVVDNMFGHHAPRCILLETGNRNSTVFLLFADEKHMDLCSCVTPPPSVIVLNVLSDAPPTHCMMSGGDIRTFRSRYY